MTLRMRNDDDNDDTNKNENVNENHHFWDKALNLKRYFCFRL